MKRSIRYLILPTVLLGGAVSAHAAPERPNYDAYYDKPVQAAAARAAKPARATPPSIAASVDAQRGVPRFIRPPKQQSLPPASLLSSPGDTARFYLGENLHRYGLGPDALQNVEVAHVHDTGRGGIIVTLRQHIDGVEVYRSDVKVLMARNLELVALSGSPRGSAASETKQSGRKFKVSPPQALANAFNDLYGLSPKATNFFPINKLVASYSYYEIGSTPEIKALDLHLIEPSRIKKVFFALPDKLVPAYYLEIIGGKTGQVTSDAYAYVIAADDGRLLYRQDLTEYDAFNYTVFADPGPPGGDGRPLDGPIADFTPHPTGTPTPAYPAFVPPIVVSMEGFNHNPGGTADPWLAAGATQSLGNNVDAYTDDDTPDGYSNGDIRALTTSAKTFNYTYNPSAEPQVSSQQSMAALVDLFYVNNWLHDWFYDSGFNEAAGNAQQNNFGRGGIGGDVFHAEGQDGAIIGSRNNANMSTPADGTSPRQQMFIWSGVNTRSVSVVGGNTLASNTAAFGPKSFDITGNAVVGVDGVGTVTDGCEPLTNGAAVAGKIALIDRGSCNFTVKVKNAQNAGAIGVLIVNNVAGGAAPSMGGADPTVTIPVLSTSFEDGGAIKTALQTGPVQLHLTFAIGTERDGTIDNGVIAHEWGHYLHHRLVSCGLQQCGGMSEGWGDFTALQMVVRPGDNLDGTFALTIYAAVSFTDAPAYFGIRRFPYSTDLTKNGLTFKHMMDTETLPTGPRGSGGAQNSEVHNMGEIWANMLFEGFTSILKQSKGTSPRYTFQEARRRMSDYVVGGMKLAPVEPSVTEQRDAILAAAYANDPADAALLAAGFAKRGAGSCAVAPPIDSANNAGIVESYDVKPNFNVLSLVVDDSVTSCDNDGALDANETGNATVKVANTSSTALTNTVVTLTSSTPGITFPNGASVTVPNIDPYSTVNVPVQIALDLGVTSSGFLDLKAEVHNSAGCVEVGTVLADPRINYDNHAATSKTDNVESDIIAWNRTGPNAADLWERVEEAGQNHLWHGADSSDVSDVQLESPELSVSATDPLIITFSHSFEFESSAGRNFDGGVIEYTTDNGKQWKDISTLVNPGYTGSVDNVNSANILAGRQAFVVNNAAYPIPENVTLNLGSQLAGKKVKVRFRIGTDAGTGADGWHIDNLAFSGIDNTPFPTVGDDTAKCTPPHAPVANAGPDQTVEVGDTVTLDGSGSTDADNDALTYSWTQTAGLIVPLSSNKDAKPTFVAPNVGVDVKFTFKLEVNDGVDTTADFVDILVKAPVLGSSSSATGSSSASGGGSSTSSSGSGSGSSTSSSGSGSGSSTSSSGSGSGASGSGSGSGASGSGSSSGSGGSSSHSSTGAGGSGDGGSGGDGGDGGSGGGSGDSCNCSTPGADTSNGSFGAGLLALSMLFFRRRRPGSRRSS